jgi:hypothetical protein
LRGGGVPDNRAMNVGNRPQPARKRDWVIQRVITRSAVLLQVAPVIEGLLLAVPAKNQRLAGGLAGGRGREEQHRGPMRNLPLRKRWEVGPGGSGRFPSQRKRRKARSLRAEFPNRARRIIQRKNNDWHHGQVTGVRAAVRLGRRILGLL